MSDVLDPRVIDQYDDHGLLLKLAFAERGVPTLLRSAADMSSAHTRHPKDFALAVKTASGVAFKFPLVDAGNAAASSLYFAENGHYLPTTLQKMAAAKLSEALTSFGLPVPDDFTKTAAMDVGYSTEGEDIMLRELFDVKDGVDTEGAYEVLQDEFDGFSPRGKRRFAMQVKTAGIDLSDLPILSSYASETMGPDVPIALEARKLLTGWGTEPVQELDVLKVKVAKAQIEPEALVAALEDFDTKHNLTHQYGKLLPDPYASTYGLSLQKTASVANVEIDGREFTGDDIVGFSQRSGDELTAKFGEDFTTQFISDPVSVLNSLPDPHKSVIAGMMDDS